MVHPHAIVRERTNSKAGQSMSKHDDAICGFSGTLPWKDGSSMPRENYVIWLKNIQRVLSLTCKPGQI